MVSRVINYKGCRIKLKQNKDKLDIDVKLPNGDRYWKGLKDNRPDKSIPMIEDDLLMIFIRNSVEEKLNA
jgi:hypothetical protein